jgi:transposase InsO family protein
VQGDNLSVDGSFVEANANKGSRIPREQLAKAAQVKQTVRQYLVELEQCRTQPKNQYMNRSKCRLRTPTLRTRRRVELLRLGYYDNYLVDNHSCVIVGVQATAARLSQETVAAQDMIARFAEWQGRKPASVAADATYGNGEFLQWLMERGITPYMRTRDSALRKNSPLYGPDRFTFLPESNSYLCPAGPATQLRRTQCSEPYLCLHRDPQTLWWVRTKSAMHHLTAEVSMIFVLL